MGLVSKILMKDLAIGLRRTVTYNYQKAITMQYPKEKWTPYPRFRGIIRLTHDEEGNLKCIACGMCARACPCGCITVKGEKKEGEKKKTLTVFQLDFTKCSLCGLCVESCPKSAIDFSQDYNIAGFSREEFHYDLIKRLEERG